MPDQPEEIVELHLGIRPEAAVSGATLVHTEAGAFLTFNAMRPCEPPAGKDCPLYEDAGTAIVEFKRCLLTRFGYPNDEARWKIPAFRETTYGIYEVRNSSWIKDVIHMNRHGFPNTKNDFITHHYLFTFHDDTFECLADGMSIEVTTAPYSEIWSRMTKRVING